MTKICSRFQSTKAPDLATFDPFHRLAFCSAPCL